VNFDAASPRWEYFVQLPSFLAPLFSIAKEPRDMITIHCLFNIHILIIFFASLQFIHPSYLLGLLYNLLNLTVFLKRFVLMMHYSQHSSPFKKEYKWINGYISYVLAPFFGIPSGQYYLHHVVMHHVENNVFPRDLSSTMPYQRDNFLHFLHYFLRYLFAIWIELPYYAFKKGRTRLAISSVVQAGGYWAVVYWLYNLNPVFTTWMILVPYILSSFLLMFGNWSQHIFVKGAGENAASITYNCINSSYNLCAFNDGYHITHHENSKLHWTDMPDRFLKNLERHQTEDAIIFEHLDFFLVGVLVFSGQLGLLAKYYVPLNEPRDKDEIVKLLKERLIPVN
jgi:hypothetical protein